MSFYYVSKVKEALPLVSEDFFSKASIGLIDRNTYDLGSERTLSLKCLALGYKCVYDPRISCSTEVPDSIAKLLHQRRRWNNAGFMSQVVMLTTPRLWFRLRTFLLMILGILDLIGSYLLLTHAVIFINAIWEPFLKHVISIEATFVIFAWVLVQIIVISSTTLATSDMFYVLNTFITGIVMAASIYFFIDVSYINLINHLINFPTQWQEAVIYLIFPVLYVITSIFSPLSFIAAIGSYLMFPTMVVTAPLYSFFHLDDFSWASR